MSNFHMDNFMENNIHLSYNVRPFNELPQYYRHVRREIVAVVPQNALNILDVGCGAGMLGKALKEENPQRCVVGIELDREAFYYANNNIDRVYNAELESFEPPFNQGEFDCIIFGDILEHLKDPWHIARKYATFLKPEGVMIASIPNIRHLPTLRQVIELGTWEYQDEGILDRTHLRFFTQKSFIELLNQANIICDSVFYLGGQELHSLRPQGLERIVRFGNLALLDVSEEEFLELCAYQLLFVGVHQPQKTIIDCTTKCQSLSKTLTSIVVPWWDHTDLLDIWKHNLEHLKDTEIIFVDNGSQPQGKLALEYFCQQHNIKLIRNEENRGFAAGNNQGAEVATGEYILFLNNDVQVLNFPLESLCNLAINGIAGPGLMQNELGESYIEGWSLCIKNSTLKALGGWCEDYGPGYWDDVDLCYRAKLAGYSLIPIPQIENLMRHKQNTTGRDGRLDQMALHIRNRGIFARKHYSTHPKIIVDGVFFQLYQTGIARVWKSLLEEWVNNGFAKHIVVLDRAGTAPKIPGIRYRILPSYDYNDTDADREILQLVCDEEGADLFISTYYTTPTTTPSVFMAYDMIPEVMEWDMNNPMWQVKHQGIQNASAYLAISENTARDLVRFFPEIPLESVKVALCGVTNNFSPASQQEVNTFQIKYGISKPYFMIVSIGGYKNTILFLKAFAQLYSKQAFDIVCTGGVGLLDEELRRYTSGSTVHMLQLSDAELKIAYSGAVALVYPSKYEGFGLPVLEAIACGCPVITCPNASIPEVAGKAALYVQDDDIQEMVNALCEVQKPSIRNSLITAGLEQAKQFSWSKMAKEVSSVLIDTTLLQLNLREINLIVFPDWSQPEESLGLELQRVISAIATHPASDRITLLIDTTDISPEDAELLLSGVTMNLLMEEDIDINESLEISLVVNLADIQWEALIPHIQARIILSTENQQALAFYGANIPAFELEKFTTQQNEQFFFT
jgi:GT2 family glycosyltransferase/2-polyprenyl-3-methyl-5-hydroxy-6-metoxy-1,4-benzoquinol methylase